MDFIEPRSRSGAWLKKFLKWGNKPGFSIIF